MAYEPTSSLDHAYADSPDAYDKRESPIARAKREMKEFQSGYNKQGEYEFHGAVSFKKGSDGRTVVLIHPDGEGNTGFGTPTFNGYAWIGSALDEDASGAYDVVIGDGFLPPSISDTPAQVEYLCAVIDNALYRMSLWNNGVDENIIDLTCPGGSGVATPTAILGFPSGVTEPQLFLQTSDDSSVTVIPPPGGISLTIKQVNFGGSVGTKWVLTN